MTSPLGEVVTASAVVVTAGSGGVGKTSVAAALGMEAARQGRSVVVVTIDPARRLADALGLGDATGAATVVAGDWSGELSVVMLDAKATFDELVVGESAPGDAERILGNSLYRSISGALSGTQEYMATEKLHQLATDTRWDLVIVDTPPTRNALDFLTAPERLLAFFDHGLYRLLTAPTRGVFRVANVATQGVMRTISRIIGASVIDDAIEFFAAIEGLEAGMRHRAAEIHDLLRADTTSFVLVATPQRDTVDEATRFAEHLDGLDIDVAAAVVNRMSPRFGIPASEARRWHGEAGDGDLGDLAANLAELAAAAELEDRHLGGLREAIRDAPIVEVGELEVEVHDLDGLEVLAERLLGR